MSGHQGFLDPIDDGVIKGWATRVDGTDHCALVDVFIDTTSIARLRADYFRPDLEAKAIRGGSAAFAFEIPEAFHDGETHVLDVRHAGTDLSLGDAPITFALGGKTRAALAEKRQWCARHLVYQGASVERLADSLKATRKVAIVSTYHELRAHLLYHRMMFEGLSKAGFTVLIVHASNRHRHDLTEIDIPNCFTILKRNIGYDFGSYAAGIFAVADALPFLEETLFINDSIVQVQGCLTSLIARFREIDAEVVSCTDSFERHYHLQSYMIWFGKRVCQSGFLLRFMADYSFTSVKDDVIDQGEIGLSRRLLAEGYVIAALCDYQTVVAAWVRRHEDILEAVSALPTYALDPAGSSYKRTLLERLDLLMNFALTGMPLNPSHFFWDVLIEDFGLPFVKRELATVNPCNVPTYFKLGTFFPSGSRALAALLEIRRLYGGNLIPPAIPHRAITADEPVSPRFRSNWRSDELAQSDPPLANPAIVKPSQQKQIAVVSS